MKTLWVPILGILGQVIVNWVTQSIKKRRFLAWKVINSLIIPKPLDKQSWNFKRNVGAYECFIQTKFRGPRSRNQKFTGWKLAKSWRFCTDISRKLLILVKNGLWFFEHTINHLSFGYVHLPHLKNYFSCFVSFFLLFFHFFLMLSTFKPLNALQRWAKSKQFDS